MAKTKENTLYFNFPIELLQGVISKQKSLQNFLNEVLYFHIYSHSKKIEDLAEYEETDLQRFERSAKFWSVKLGNSKTAFKQGEKIYKNNTCKVFTGINSDIFWDFYKNVKQDFDIECLIMFLAMRSIVGNKREVNTNKAFVTARMFGFATIGENIFNLPFTRYHWDKIIITLETDWNLKYFSSLGFRGFRIGINTTLENIIFNAETSKAKNKKSELKDRKKEILVKIRNSI